MKDERYCSECGYKIEGSSSSCNNCGHNNIESKSKTNGLAIAGFVTSLANILFCGSLALVSLILSIIGLTNCKKNNEGGKKLALTGIIISSILIVVFIGCVFIGILFMEPEDSSTNLNINTNKTDTVEKTTIKKLKSNLIKNTTLNYYELNSENKYDVKIKYEKEQLSAYICASDAQNYVKNIIGNSNINSIEFECINENGTFNYVKFENIYSINFENIDNNTKYYDKDYNQIETNLEILEANRINDYKNSCKSFNFKDVMRNPKDYQDKNAYWFGKIIQVVSKTSYASIFRVGVTCEKYTYLDEYYCEDTIYVTYYGKESFIEDDIVKLWGIMDGTETYTTVLGASVTIPKFIATYMELQ